MPASTVAKRCLFRFLPKEEKIARYFPKKHHHSFTIDNLNCFSCRRFNININFDFVLFPSDRAVQPIQTHTRMIFLFLLYEH